ncbi:MAG: sugar phosphate isomerase/epimerase [Chloroflexi bacterium]|nr:sugar phosphate isomerase/epimerase [Chloroflexota bacterium]
MSTRWPLSAYTISIPHMAPEQAVVAVRDAGYTGIEWSVHSHSPEISRQPTRLHRNDLGFVEAMPEAVRHARVLSEAAGLRISGLGLGGQFNRPDAAREAFELGEIAGAPCIRIQAGSTLEGASFASAFESAQRICDGYVREAEHHPDVKVVLHQHWGTATASASSLYRLLSRYDPRLIGCIYDPGNMFVEGYEDYRVGLGLLGSYVAHVHLKNVRYAHGLMVDGWHREWAPLDDGLVDLRHLFRALDEIGYAGWIVMSDVGESREEMAMLRYNHAYVAREMECALQDA